jgi:uncharacterized iron-regulated membrane protein
MHRRRGNGSLVTVAAVRRLHPRHWDGHRLLQFLTGLALLTLAFGTTAASAPPASPPATAVTTTVEAPAAAAAAPTVRDEAARTSPRSEECRHDASRAARAVPPAADTATLAGIAQQAQESRAPPLR